MPASDIQWWPSTSKAQGRRLPAENFEREDKRKLWQDSMLEVETFVPSSASSPTRPSRGKLPKSPQVVPTSPLGSQWESCGDSLLAGLSASLYSRRNFGIDGSGATNNSSSAEVAKRSLNFGGERGMALSDSLVDSLLMRGIVKRGSKLEESLMSKVRTLSRKVRDEDALDPDVLEASLREDAQILIDCREILFQLRRDAEQQSTVATPIVMLPLDSPLITKCDGSTKCLNSDIGSSFQPPRPAWQDFSGITPASSPPPHDNIATAMHELRKFSTSKAASPAEYLTPPTVRSSARHSPSSSFMAKGIALEHAAEEIERIVSGSVPHPCGLSASNSLHGRLPSLPGPEDSDTALSRRPSFPESEAHSLLGDPFHCAEAAIEALFTTKADKRVLSLQVKELSESNASLRRQLEGERQSRLCVESENTELRVCPSHGRDDQGSNVSEVLRLRRQVEGLKGCVAAEKTERLRAEEEGVELRGRAEAGGLLADEVMALRGELEVAWGAGEREARRTEEARQAYARLAARFADVERERDGLAANLVSANAALREYEEGGLVCVSCMSLARELERERKRTAEVDADARFLLERKLADVESAAERAMHVVMTAAATVEARLRHEAAAAKMDAQGFTTVVRAGVVGGWVVKIAELQAEVASLKTALAAVKGPGVLRLGA